MLKLSQKYFSSKKSINIISLITEGQAAQGVATQFHHNSTHNLSTPERQQHQEQQQPQPTSTTTTSTTA